MNLRKKFRTIDWRLPVLLLYCVLFLVLTIFHEPWYDEAQAWLIAKNATLKELLFTIPHYEGHPPLWYLILRPFAKLGLPYEPSIKAVSFIISTAAIWLLLYRSKLPQPLKYTLPFTYFLLYQYGVISRPYCVMMLAFFLAACAYTNRRKKPWPFVGALLLLCAASSYGIVLAGGITIAWLLEFYKRGDSPKTYGKRVLHARAFIPLLVLLLVALVLIALVFPAADANGINMEDVQHGFFYRFVYMLFIAPLDALFYQSMGYGALVWQDITWYLYAIGLIIGIVVFIMLARYAAKCKKLALLVIPEVLYALFCARVYFWTHHLGIWLLFLLFFLWCCYENPAQLPELSNDRLQTLYYLLPIFSVSVSLLWTITAGYDEITTAYGHGRALHAFLEEYNLTEGDYSIMISWSHIEDEDTGETSVDPVDCTLGIGVLPYYKNNLFFNFRKGTNEQAFSYNRLPNEEDSQEVIDYVRTVGMPDIVIGDCYMSDLYDATDYAIVDYTVVAVFDDNYLWKNVIYENYYYVYIRSDLAEELGLEEIPLRENDTDND